MEPILNPYKRSCGSSILRWHPAQNRLICRCLEKSTHAAKLALCRSAPCVAHDLGALQDAQDTEGGCIWIANNVPVLWVDHISVGRTLLRVPPTF
jgi:hypothetical protein